MNKFLRFESFLFISFSASSWTLQRRIWNVTLIHGKQNRCAATMAEWKIIVIYFSFDLAQLDWTFPSSVMSPREVSNRNSTRCIAGRFWRAKCQRELTSDEIEPFVLKRIKFDSWCWLIMSKHRANMTSKNIWWKAQLELFAVSFAWTRKVVCWQRCHYRWFKRFICLL